MSEPSRSGSTAGKHRYRSASCAEVMRRRGIGRNSATALPPRVMVTRPPAATRSITSPPWLRRSRIEATLTMRSESPVRLPFRGCARILRGATRPVRPTGAEHRFRSPQSILTTRTLNGITCRVRAGRQLGHRHGTHCHAHGQVRRGELLEVDFHRRVEKPRSGCSATGHVVLAQHCVYIILASSKCSTPRWISRCGPGHSPKSRNSADSGPTPPTALGIQHKCPCTEKGKSQQRESQGCGAGPGQHRAGRGARCRRGRNDSGSRDRWTRCRRHSGGC